MSNDKKEFEKSVLIIDAQPIAILGIQQVLKEKFNVFYSASDPREGMSIALTHKPQLIILDFNLPETFGDILIRELRPKIPYTKFICYTSQDSSETVLKVLKAGVNGFVTKNSPIDEINTAVDIILSGRDYFSKQARNHIINTYGGDDTEYQKKLISNTGFSSKEIEIIKLLCKEMSTKQISSIVHLTPRTVEQYRSNMGRRIGAKNLAGIIKFAIKNSIISLDEL